MGDYVVVGRQCTSGPDVSMYQPGTNFAAVRAAGETIAFIKATEGVGYMDPWFTRHAAAANAAGILWGPYHFARPGNNPIAEANWFVQIIRANPGWMLPPVLDMEQPGTGQWVLTFCETVEAATRIPVIYTGAYVQYDRPPGLTRYDLWEAAYNAGYSPNPNPEAIGQPPSCAPWGPKWRLWQYTSSADISGVPGRCDRSVVEKQWVAEVTGSQPQPPPPEDDMPYTPEQLQAITVNGVTQASVFLARDPSDGGIYVFCRLSMDRRHLDDEAAVEMARTQLGIPWLRGDSEPNQDVDPKLVKLFALNNDDGASTVMLTPAATADLVAAVATAVADEEARRLQN